MTTLNTLSNPLGNEKEADFDRWITELREDVIEGEHGFEPGEFTVFPEAWEPLYREGLTPSQAFRRALNAHKSNRAFPVESDT